jgi:hypothetical protein
MATERNNCVRLSGSLLLPPYPLPAGFIVTKIPLLKSTLTREPRKAEENVLINK